MTDIVERLRTEAQEICADTYPRWKNADETMDEAADEIERLRDVIEQYEKDVRIKSIKQAKREALLEAADKLANDWNCIGGFPEDRLRRMAEELK